MEMGFILIIPPVQTAISAALPRPGSAQGLLWAWFILPVEIHIPQCTAWCFCTHPIRIVLYTCLTLFSRVVTPIFFWLRKKKKNLCDLELFLLPAVEKENLFQESQTQHVSAPYPGSPIHSLCIFLAL